MPMTLGRSICCDLNETISREWLVTNGLGGYAAGTVAGVLTRRQHGLLVAVPPDAVTPQLLLAKIDEEVVFDQRTYYLGTNEYRDGTLNPAGFVHLETFHIEDSFPVFTYRLGGINGIMLEKRIWMEYGRNTTYIQYRVLRTARTEETVSQQNKREGRRGTGSPLRGGNHKRFQQYAEAAPRSLELTLLPFSAYRPYNILQQGTNNKQYQLHVYRNAETSNHDAYATEMVLPQGIAGCTLRPKEGTWQSNTQSNAPYHILAVGHPDSHVTLIPTGVWYWNFLLRHEGSTQEPATDDLYLPGVIRATLWPGEDTTLTIMVSTEDTSALHLDSQQLQRTYQQNVERQRSLLFKALQTPCYFGKGGEAAQTQHLRVLPSITMPDLVVSNETAQTQHLRILPFATTPDPVAGGEEYLHTLLQAGDRFLVQRKVPYQKRDRNPFFDRTEYMPFLLSNYYDMEHRTRDALIALPGLMLVAEHHDDALKFLRSLLPHFRGGLLPEHLPLPGQTPQEDEYSSVDLPLWFCYALDHYLRTTGNYEFLEEFYSRLSGCINCYIEGTSHGIQVDPADGLLKACQPGKALTWMNATVKGQPVTPRSGKPVEVNALWYHALSLMDEWSQYLSHRGQIDAATLHYQEWRRRCKRSFQERFWYAQEGYLYDVLDGPDSNDSTLRPNQLLALSLRYPVFDTEDRHAVFGKVTEHLLTPYGLRTLSPRHSAYRGSQGRLREEAQQNLHQGNVWTWLMGPYIEAMLKMSHHSAAYSHRQHNQLYQEYLWRKGLHLLEPFKDLFEKDILGMNAGIFAGEAPYQAQPGTTSALGCAELLRIYHMLAQLRIAHTEHVLIQAPSKALSD